MMCYPMGYYYSSLRSTLVKYARMKWKTLLRYPKRGERELRYASISRPSHPIFGQGTLNLSDSLPVDQEQSF